MNYKIAGAIAVMIAATLWGLDGVVLTPRLFSLDIVFVVFMLHAIPFIIMQPFLFKKWKEFAELRGENLLGFLSISFFGGFLGTYAIVKALFLVNFKALSIVILLQKLQPVFAIILAGIILKEKLKKNFLLLASTAILGSYIMTFGVSLPDINSNLLPAAVWAIVAASSFGSATVFGKLVLKRYDFKTATFIRFGMTGMLMAVLTAFMGSFQFFNITAEQWAIFIIIAFTTGSGAIFLYYWGMNRIKAMTATIAELMFPFSAIIFDFLVNKTIISATQWAGAILMMLSVVLIVKKQR